MTTPRRRIDAAALARIGALIRDESPCNAARGRTRGVICLVAAFVTTMVAAQISEIHRMTFHDAASSGSSLEAPRRGTHVNSTEDREMALLKHAAMSVVVSGVLAAAAYAQEVPAGFALVTDSQLAFSNVQGTGGWRYRFDRGVGTIVEDMGYFVADSLWCATPNWAGSTNSLLWSHCMLGAYNGHPNSANPCPTPAQGILCPSREWTSSAPTSAWVRLGLEWNPGTSGVRFDLLADGAVVWSKTCSAGTVIPVDEWITLASFTTLAIRVDPLDHCGADGFSEFIKIYTPDCDGNAIADSVDIADGTLADTNNNGVPDCCDLGVNCNCAGDVDGNGVVDGVDLASVLVGWGSDGAKHPGSDTNADGTVDAVDLAVVLDGWGRCR